MKLPQSLDGSTCEELVSRWGISVELATRLLELSRIWTVRFGGIGSLRIISGYRTQEEQEALELEGRPAAPDELSTHRSCPATGADVLRPLEPGTYELLEYGTLIRRAGLRWGGGSPAPDGIPTDWPHLDLGPRRA